MTARSPKARATALAHPNIALVKYWGKRDERLNLPAAGSLSLTLEGLRTRTTVTFDDSLDRDLVLLNNKALSGRNLQRISAFLDLVRQRADVRAFAAVQTENDFPTAAGLASSSSGFAALAAASTAALGLKLSSSELSTLARQGSGSAARSVLGGFAEMRPGERPDGLDAYAVPVAPAAHWNLRCLVLLTAQGEKDLGSTDAMNHTSRTSPYFPAWVESVPQDLAEARDAIARRDFMHLAKVAERSCLRFHASALAADPGILYWNGLTLQLIHRVRQLRDEGLKVFFTIDAGPHVKVFCEAGQLAAIKPILQSVPGVQDVLTARPGQGVMLEDEQGNLSSPWIG